jgi:cell wall-associated NlpC family hydrolase
MRTLVLTALLVLLTGCGSMPVYRGTGIRCRGPSGVPLEVDRETPFVSGPGHSTPVHASDAVRRLLRELDGWYGTPYVYGGTTKNGTDCSGLTQALYRSVGIEIPRRASRQAVAARNVSRGSLRAGDLVFFNTTGSGISHVGVYLGDGHFAHAATSRGVVRESMTHPYYTTRFVQGGRFIE